MKRFSPQHVNQVAREFKQSTTARAWFFFGADIQNAIIDSLVLGEIRAAYSADSAKSFTPEEIVVFRDAVKVALVKHCYRVDGDESWNAGLCGGKS